MTFDEIYQKRIKFGETKGDYDDGQRNGALVWNANDAVF